VIIVDVMQKCDVFFTRASKLNVPLCSDLKIVREQRCVFTERCKACKKGREWDRRRDERRKGKEKGKYVK
jgi:hypothetical protein